jgi:hypothetical protein
MRETKLVRSAIGGEAIRVLPGDRAHVIHMVEGMATLTELHITTAKALTGFKVIARIHEDIPCFVAKDVPVVKTTAGRNAVPGVHPITQVWDGAWVPNGSLMHFSVFQESVPYVSGRRPPATTPLTELKNSYGNPIATLIKQRAASWLSDYEPATLDHVQSLMAELLLSNGETGRTRFRWADDAFGYVTDNFAGYPSDYGNRAASSTKWMEMVAAARRLVADTSELILVNGSRVAREQNALSRLAQMVLVMQAEAEAYIAKNRISAQAANEDVEDVEDERFVIAA